MSYGPHSAAVGVVTPDEASPRTRLGDSPPSLTQRLARISTAVTMSQVYKSWVLPAVGVACRRQRPYTILV